MYIAGTAVKQTNIVPAGKGAVFFQNVCPLYRGRRKMMVKYHRNMAGIFDFSFDLFFKYPSCDITAQIVKQTGIHSGKYYLAGVNLFPITGACQNLFNHIHAHSDALLISYPAVLLRW